MLLVAGEPITRAMSPPTTTCAPPCTFCPTNTWSLGIRLSMQYLLIDGHRGSVQPAPRGAVSGASDVAEDAQRLFNPARLHQRATVGRSRKRSRSSRPVLKNKARLSTDARIVWLVTSYKPHLPWLVRRVVLRWKRCEELIAPRHQLPDSCQSFSRRLPASTHLVWAPSPVCPPVPPAPKACISRWVVCPGRAPSPPYPLHRIQWWFLRSTCQPRVLGPFKAGNLVTFVRSRSLPLLPARRMPVSSKEPEFCGTSHQSSGAQPRATVCGF